MDASIAGTGNTIVQIVGDGNTVVAGHPHLVLTRYVARRQIRQELDRLSPYTRSTPLLGREAELASLHAFLDSSAPMAARVLTGSGGSGKTRLALELCEQASERGWAAGFVGRDELRRFFGAQSLSAWGWRKPTLIVVDYAAEHAELLGRWLDELVDRPVPPEQPIRLLLLERSASTETGWWTTVFASGGYGATGKRALLDPAEPIGLDPLLGAEPRLALLRATLEQAGSPGTSELRLDDASVREKVMQTRWGGRSAVSDDGGADHVADRPRERALPRAHRSGRRARRARDRAAAPLGAARPARPEAGAASGGLRHARARHEP